MTIQNTSNNPKKFEEWLNINEGFIEDLKNRDLTTDDTRAFYERLQASNVFGDSIIIKIDKTVKLKNSRQLIVATVMEPTIEGYQHCTSPISSYSSWTISANVSSSVEVKSDVLYQTTFIPEIHPSKREQLITFDPDTLVPIDLSFNESLKLIGGNALADVASQIYEGDLESVLFSKFVSHNTELIQNSYKEIQEKQEQINTLQQEVSSKEKQLNIQIQEFNTTEKELQKSHKKEILIMNRDHQKKVDKLTRRERRLYEILSDIRDESPSQEINENQDVTIHPWNVETNVSMLQRLFYHNNNQTLYYGTQVIETFLRALQTNTLVILSGPSGTGKSSLINAFADAFQSSTAKVIPVQSSWTDKQDLLGYFNTIEKRYVPTPFLEAILNARESNGLHLICLDEMNLSHVEYYFAELLSARELNIPINLYPKRYRKEAQEIIEEFSEIESPSREDKERYRNAIELDHYPFELSIPKNVRFVGTVNMDHTVKPLSPKVIDRSFILELTYQAADLELKAELNNNPVSGKIEFDLDVFSSDYLSIEKVIDDTHWIVSLSDKLNVIPDAKINSRSEKQISKFLQMGPLSSEGLMNQLVLSKLLPRIHFSSGNEEAMAVCEGLVSDLRLKQLTTSINRFEKMKKGGRYINFFK